jgi:hypothetical protein
MAPQVTHTLAVVALLIARATEALAQRGADRHARRDSVPGFGAERLQPCGIGPEVLSQRHQILRSVQGEARNERGVTKHVCVSLYRAFVHVQRHRPKLRGRRRQTHQVHFERSVNERVPHAVKRRQLWPQCAVSPEVQCRHAALTADISVASANIGSHSFARCMRTVSKRCFSPGRPASGSDISRAIATAAGPRSVTASPVDPAPGVSPSARRTPPPAAARAMAQSAARSRQAPY